MLHTKLKDSKNPRGMVQLDRCRVRIISCKGIHAGYCVAVESPSRNYTLFPDSRKEAVEWAVAIEHNSLVHRKIRQEEEARTKQLARMKLSQAKLEHQQSSSGSLSPPIDPQSLIGKDVASDDFRDFVQLSEQGEELPVVETRIGAYYDLLGVPATASAEMIRKSYHKLAKMFHPDKNTTIDAERFALINQAFHVVQDPEARERYNLGERVKHALRRGVLVRVHDDDDDEPWPAALYIGPSFTALYWQDAEFGSVLRKGFRMAELRFIQEIIASEDDENWKWDGKGKRCLTINGQRLGHDHIRLELDTEESRDEILDGLRILRCEQSMLFVQKLEKWLADGNR